MKMSPRTLAKRIEQRSWKLKDKLIDMHHQAEDAGLTDLSDELAGAFMQMDEVICEAERNSKGEKRP